MAAHLCRFLVLSLMLLNLWGQTEGKSVKVRDRRDSFRVSSLDRPSHTSDTEESGYEGDQTGPQRARWHDNINNPESVDVWQNPDLDGKPPTRSPVKGTTTRSAAVDNETPANSAESQAPLAVMSKLERLKVLVFRLQQRLMRLAGRSEEPMATKEPAHAQSLPTELAQTKKGLRRTLKQLRVRLDRTKDRLGRGGSRNLHRPTKVTKLKTKNNDKSGQKGKAVSTLVRNEYKNIGCRLVKETRRRTKRGTIETVISEGSFGPFQALGGSEEDAGNAASPWGSFRNFQNEDEVLRDPDGVFGGFPVEDATPVRPPGFGDVTSASWAGFGSNSAGDSSRGTLRSRGFHAPDRKPGGEFVRSGFDQPGRPYQLSHVGRMMATHADTERKGWRQPRGSFEDEEATEHQGEDWTSEGDTWHEGPISEENLGAKPLPGGFLPEDNWSQGGFEDISHGSWSGGDPWGGFQASREIQEEIQEEAKDDMAWAINRHGASSPAQAWQSNNLHHQMAKPDSVDEDQPEAEKDRANAAVRQENAGELDTIYRLECPQE